MKLRKFTNPIKKVDKTSNSNSTSPYQEFEDQLQPITYTTVMHLEIKATLTVGKFKYEVDKIKTR